MNLFVKTAVRTLFLVTSRRRAARRARRHLAGYLELAEGLPREEGMRPVRIPPMRGVDEDMRDWSFFMILEHNRIVNRSITATVRQLARGEPSRGAAAIDPKTDVLPSPAAGEEQVEEFRKSVEEHLETVPTLGRLRGTRTAPHPVFGDFDAHRWNCMFAFHLGLHLPQAAHVLRAVEAGRSEPLRKSGGAKSGSAK
jgi:hypothetical protein